jgi:hypothetical protein
MRQNIQTPSGLRTAPWKSSWESIDLVQPLVPARRLASQIGDRAQARIVAPPRRADVLESAQGILREARSVGAKLRDGIRKAEAAVELAAALRASLDVPAAPTDPASAISAADFRGWLRREVPPGERIAQIAAAGLPGIQAVAHWPPGMSGLTPESLAQVCAAAIQEHHGPRLAELDAANEAAVSTATACRAALDVMRGHLKQDLGLPDAEALAVLDGRQPGRPNLVDDAA